jgi:uncharacterized membrane protein YgcG
VLEPVLAHQSLLWLSLLLSWLYFIFGCLHRCLHGGYMRDRSLSEYLYAVVPRNVLFAQRRVARLNLTRHAAATAICSRGSRGGGGFGGGGCGTAAEGRGLGSGSIASWLWSAQPSLSWRGGYKASEMRVPAFGLLTGAAPLA